MSVRKVYTVIGMMSGTSVDGVDAALIRTDGHFMVERLGSVHIPYSSKLREHIKKQFGKTQTDMDVRIVEEELTLEHAKAVKLLCDKYSDERIDLIGFHGQTISHDPSARFTKQIGDGALLARETGIDVIDDFRWADVKAGGQGAPLIPVYHQALAKSADIDLPCAILNIGGVSNVTYIGESENDILTFDTGPGNALMDDFILERMNMPFDDSGRVAAEGTEHKETINAFMSQKFFEEKPPKSLDRNPWVFDVSLLETADGLATLSAFTRESIIASVRFMPSKPKCWYICGGGRKNTTLLRSLRHRLKVPVEPVDTLGWDGDALEAEGFGYLAVRSLLDLPLSLPTTTGVPKPQTGGVYHKAGDA